MTEKPPSAIYIHRSTTPADGLGPQQQAAAAWDAAERLGVEAQWVDGAELDRDPHELLGEG